MNDEIFLDHDADYLRLYIEKGEVKIAVGNKILRDLSPNTRFEIAFTPTQTECYNLGKQLRILGANTQDIPDPDIPCPEFSPASNYFHIDIIQGNISQECETNGHYLCNHCVHKKP